MYRIAIVDDDTLVRSQLRSYFESYQEKTGQQFQLQEYAFAELFLTNYRPVFDLVLMDIDMPGMDGLDAAKRMRALDEKAVLLFVTNLAQYAIRGYEVAATDFVVKPVDYQKFEHKLKRALNYVPTRRRPTLLLKTENGTATVEIDDVQYVEVMGHNVFYHTAKEVYRIRGSLRQAQEEMDDPRFFVCDKCYLVNLGYVEAVGGGTVTVAGDRINVSRARKKALMDALAAFHNRI